MASLAPTAIMHVSWVEFISRRGERQGGSVATQLPSSQIQMLRPVHKSACVNRPQNLLGNGQPSPYGRGTTLILIGGTEATGHEAEAKFQKKTQ